MNSIRVEKSELKRRADATRAFLKRNVKYMKQCGFYQMTEGMLIMDEEDKSTGIKHRWMCGAVTLDPRDHDFHSAREVTQAVHRNAYRAGEMAARSNIKIALGL